MTIRFVDVAATGANDGTSWEDAFTTIGAAITAATSGDDLWIKEGTYAGATITCKDGVDMFGGFDSALTGTGGSVVGRNLAVDITYIDGQATRRCVVGGAMEFNGFHVINGYTTATNAAGIHVSVTGTMVVRNCVIDSCHNHAAAGEGAGVSVKTLASMTLEDCTISHNEVDLDGLGAGIYVMTAGTVTMERVTVHGNTCPSHGAGMYSDGVMVLTDCTFTDNIMTAWGGGGGLYMGANSLTAVRCKFSGNQLSVGDFGSGGAIRCSSGTASLTNCIIQNNYADNNGGGIWVNTTLDVVNCVISDNTAAANGGAIYINAGTTTVTNSIAWGNSPATQITAGATVTYSCVQGGYTGTGNISTDPKFIGSGDNPYNIQSISPCIDAGNGDVAPATDYLGNPRVDDLDVANTGTGTPAYTDIGAYEYQWVASGTTPLLGLWSPI